MKYNRTIHHRRSIRIGGYDYSRSGAYFFTTCVQNREHLFGEIENGRMITNHNGKIVSNFWFDLVNHYENIVLDDSVIMPNHFHGIIIITGHDDVADVVGAIHELPLRDGGPIRGVGATDHDDTAVVGDHDNGVGDHDNGVGAIHELPLRELPLHERGLTPRDLPATNHRSKRRNMLLSKIMGRFKMVTSKHINISRKTPGVRVWQRNYWEHIIRNEDEFSHIRNYIKNNPIMWEQDKLNGGLGNRNMKPQTEYRGEFWMS